MTITNEEKRQVYSVLKTKLKIALQQEFFLEALLLEYAIVEDRLSSILRSSSLVYMQNDGTEIFIKKKIKKIRDAYKSKRFPIYKKVQMELMDEIEDWLSVRNDLVHKSCTRVYNSKEVAGCAAVGNDLVRRISNTARNLKRTAEKAAGV